jgi:hypothetical protein
MFPRLLTDGKVSPDEILVNPETEEEVEITENFPLSK